MSRHIEFTADYRHVWPSRALTAFPKGYAGRVKADVADAAIAAGKAVERKIVENVPVEYEPAKLAPAARKSGKPVNVNG